MERGTIGVKILQNGLLEHNFSHDKTWTLTMNDKEYLCENQHRC